MRRGSTGGSDDDRRDYRRRANCPARLMKRLLAVNDGLSVADLAEHYMPFDAAQRILRQFAMKGFVRRDHNRWLATPLLISGSHTVLAEESS